MDIALALRICDAFETFRNGSLPREVVRPDQTNKDVEYIRQQYNELKWRIGFAEAARQAKADFLLRVSQ
jgi:hypothetical protein